MNFARWAGSGPGRAQAGGDDAGDLHGIVAELRAKGLVVNRKEGTQVFYALRDPLLSEVLRNMRRYFQAHVQEALRILTEL